MLVKRVKFAFAHSRTCPCALCHKLHVVVIL
jgi:hypothetical protein